MLYEGSNDAILDIARLGNSSCSLKGMVLYLLRKCLAATYSYKYEKESNIYRTYMNVCSRSPEALLTSWHDSPPNVGIKCFNDSE